MKKYFLMALCLLCIIFFTGGCIDDIIPVNKEDIQPQMSDYEFEVFLNNSYDNGHLIPTYSFYLSGNGSVKVVSIVENTSVIDIIPLEDLSTSNSEILSDVVIMGNSGSNFTSTPEYFTSLSRLTEMSDINYTISEDVVRGQKHVYINFEQPVTGFVACTMSIPLGQDFMYITTPPSVVRFVLPEGYTTGNSLIGKVKPTPDYIYSDSMGRENLVWHNEVTSTGLWDLLGNTSGNETDIEPVPKLISIKFYLKSAPMALSIAMAILSAIALGIYFRYRSQKRRLEQIRKEIENKGAIPKKKGKD